MFKRLEVLIVDPFRFPAADAVPKLVFFSRKHNSSLTLPHQLHMLRRSDMRLACGTRTVLWHNATGQSRTVRAKRPTLPPPSNSLDRVGVDRDPHLTAKHL